MLADGDNVFIPKFLNSLHSTVTNIHEKNLNECQNTRSKLKDDPIGLILSLYSQAVKKNDTRITLGKVEFRNVTAKEIITEEVNLKIIM